MPRLIRVLVYEGSQEELNKVLRLRGVKGSHTIPIGNGVLIREAILGDFLEEFDTILKCDGDNNA